MALCSGRASRREGIGYSIGFLMVIHGRMQLFTKQTIVTVLPVM
jgi:formate-nitrite transporter family protein